MEPESSGVGCGGFLVHYRAADRVIDAYDGREWAPAGARPDMFLRDDGEPMICEVAQASGLAIGTPGLVAMLALAHEEHGTLPWARLMEPAIRLAEDGFVVGPRLARSLDTFKANIAADPQRDRSIWMRKASRGRRGIGCATRNTRALCERLQRIHVTPGGLVHGADPRLEGRAVLAPGQEGRVAM